MGNFKKTVSIKDVARISGVSVATVSRIINNTGRFSKETQEKVNKVIKELGYGPNKLAVSLRSHMSHSVGILVPDITNEFYAAIVKKCESLLFENNFSSIICNTERSSVREKAYLQMLMEHRVDGLIIISSNISGESLVSQNLIPTIYIDREPDNKNRLIISSAHYEGGLLATNFLLKQNLSPFLVMTKTKSSSTLARVRAFKDTLKKAKIKNIDSRILSLNITSDNFIARNIELNQFIKNAISSPGVPGVFGINDHVAYMVIKSANELGIKVPNQLSVIGFDGTYFSDVSSPKITTIVQNTDILAKKACDSLLNLISNTTSKEAQSGVIEVPVHLVIKESTI
ncbi:hypothetical protein C5L31_000145 [Secundilactobacillus malefermentans]|uniref:HTH lacI-type domain-containing protein n=1 Tax=Secundilactobacillus malefermentans TaxID=176292 RepID=A0A4R5NS11_9LACO|nr:LacI family DNA-binding transcriptional regulator [Secundilactobacillus malefermentans]KRM56684.1 LacI family transcriptional regulator [Secundilactobacillus malefermentans DSM 5705 = KCTC 3548]TDG79349.1 hypothetical protein C5L31_000145 [Secundilactobacillus malefermentans]